MIGAVRALCENAPLVSAKTHAEFGNDFQGPAAFSAWRENLAYGTLPTGDPTTAEAHRHRHRAWA